MTLFSWFFKTIQSNPVGLESFLYGWLSIVPLLIYSFSRKLREKIVQQGGINVKNDVCRQNSPLVRNMLAL